MPKKILVTGATDGIGLEAAKLLAANGHTLLLHGRSQSKLQSAKAMVAYIASSNSIIETFCADFSDLSSIEVLAASILLRHPQLDVIINNVGVWVPGASFMTSDKLDVHFAVNTIAPYQLTRLLLTALHSNSRIVNVSSSKQATVRFNDLMGEHPKLNPFEAYSQSKLALIMWSKHMAEEFGTKGPTVFTVNPGSMLATNMVTRRLGAGVGHDVMIGTKILYKAAVDDEFAEANGQYFDNDIGAFGMLHRNARDPKKNRTIVDKMEEILENVNASSR